MEPSSPTMPVAAVATAMDWGEIIFPTTHRFAKKIRPEE